MSSPRPSPRPESSSKEHPVFTLPSPTTQSKTLPPPKILEWTNVCFQVPANASESVTGVVTDEDLETELQYDNVREETVPLTDRRSLTGTSKTKNSTTTSGKASPDIKSSSAATSNFKESDSTLNTPKTKTILNSVSGCLRGGEVTALLGPSGSGKSTLLNILSGRQRLDKSNTPKILTSSSNTNSDSVTNSVYYNGRQLSLLNPRESSELKKATAFVLQDDLLSPFQTVEESLTFSAKLQLQNSTTKSTNTVSEQNQNQNLNPVSDLISTLGLTSCKDTIIGNALQKGVSGGERKRTAIGMELISQPDIIFLDEPTSGLDSFAAVKLVRYLKKIAVERNCMVCLTVHQPGSEIFECFDRVICLREGRVMCEGRVGLNTSLDSQGGGSGPGGGESYSILDFLAQLKKPCPRNYNPADWLLLLAQTMGEEEAEEFFRLTEENLHRKMKKLGDGDVIQVAVDGGTDSSDLERLLKSRTRSSWLTQFSCLASRELQATFRNNKALRARFAMCISQALVYALIFQSQGLPFNSSSGTNPVSQLSPPDFLTKLQSDFGCICAVLIGCMFQNSQPILLNFPLEKPVFNREFSSNMYSSTAYVAAKTAVELPLCFVNCLLTFLIVYWPLGLNGSFYIFVLVAWGLGCAAASIASLISAGTSSAQAAMQLSPAAFVPQIMLSGVFVSLSSYPEWLQPLQYVAPLKFAINLSVSEELFRPTAYITNRRTREEIWGPENYEQSRKFLRRMGIADPDGNDSSLNGGGGEGVNAKLTEIMGTRLAGGMMLLTIFCVFRVGAWMLLWRSSGYLYK